MTQEPQSIYEIRAEARRAELRLLDERDRRRRRRTIGRTRGGKAARSSSRLPPR